MVFDGHLKDAAAIQHRLLDLDPDYLGAHGWAARTALLMGENTDAVAEAQKVGDEERRLQNLALVYWVTDRKTDADAALRQLEGKFANVAAYDIGTVHAYRGEADAAVTWLERAYRQRDGSMLVIKVDPLLRNLRSDARYKVLLRTMNLPE